MGFLEAFREPERIKPVHLLCCGLVWLAMMSMACQRPTVRNSEVQFKGKTYVIAGLQGAGYTRENRSPVYTLVVMAKEDVKKWTKE